MNICVGSHSFIWVYYRYFILNAEFKKVKPALHKKKQNNLFIALIIVVELYIYMYISFCI